MQQNQEDSDQTREVDFKPLASFLLVHFVQAKGLTKMYNIVMKYTGLNLDDSIKLFEELDEIHSRFESERCIYQPDPLP